MARGFDPLVLYGVVEPSTYKVNFLPEEPDTKYYVKCVDDIIRDIENEEPNDAITNLNSLRSDLDIGSELRDYINASNETINKFHTAIKDLVLTYEDLDQENITKTSALQFIDRIGEILDEIKPDAIGASAWGYLESDARSLAHNAQALKRANFHWDPESDCYVSTIKNNQSKGSVYAKIYPNGDLYLNDHFNETSLLFKKEKEQYSYQYLLYFSNKDNKFGPHYKMKDFKEYFEDWINPTDEEIALFNASMCYEHDFTILKFLSGINHDI